jgi:hypothetical protein
MYADRVQETSTTTGTGTLTLAGAINGYQSFLTAFGSATPVEVMYTISDGTNWEVGQGTYTGSALTLSRTLVLASSNGNALVNFSAASLSVWCDLPATGIGQVANTIGAAPAVVIPDRNQMIFARKLAVHGKLVIKGSSQLVGIR